MAAEECGRERLEYDPEQEREVEPDEPAVHPLDAAEDLAVARPVRGEDEEADREGEDGAGDLEHPAQGGLDLAAGDVVRDAEVQDEQGHRDREHGVREEQDPLVLEALRLAPAEREPRPDDGRLGRPDRGRPDRLGDRRPDRLGDRRPDRLGDRRPDWLGDRARYRGRQGSRYRFYRPHAHLRCLTGRRPIVGAPVIVR